MAEVSIVGGSGYGGGEILRILMSHPEIRIKQVTSERFAGRSVSAAHPNLRGGREIVFSRLEELEGCDFLFVCLPNGKSMEFMGDFIKLAPKIIDLGADFRLKAAKEWERWYGKEHKNPGLIKRFIYGLPEVYRKELRRASYVAGPGCEAIVSILCLRPLVEKRVIDLEKIIIDAKMSSSQAGNKVSNSSHHPERKGVVRSYLPTGHRHTAEIEQELSLRGKDLKVAISATAVEIVRGGLVTVHTFLKKEFEEKDIWKIYHQEYKKERFVRVVKQKDGLYRYPEPKILQGTNFCEIGFEKDDWGRRLVIIGAIDNLVKGTGGNAIQCMNLMMGFKEDMGLGFLGLHPI